MMSQSELRVVKFGGTSVADAEGMRRAISLVATMIDDRPGSRVIVVTSALGGVTDRLIDAIREAEARTEAHRNIRGNLFKR